MSFTTLALAAIRDLILADWLSLNPQIATTPDSDNYIRATGFASAVEGLYQHQQWGVRQQFADTADSEYLEHHAAMRSMSRKAAAQATGTVRMTGLSGSSIPLGTAFTVGDVAYLTTAAATMPAPGTVDIAAIALVAGVAANQTAAAAATLTSSPAGIDSAATLLAMTGGVDIESDASRGGSKADWKRWAEEVSGVDKAYVYGLRSGLGTVDVCITTSSGVPSSTLIQAVVDHIDPLRPVDVPSFNVIAPTPLAVPVTIQLTLANGYALPSVTDDVNATLAVFFKTIAPGDTVFKSQIEALISEVSGVVDRVVSLPASNVVPTVNTSQIGWAVLGTVTVT
jgi:uncharacterized phage protein gp47/JayE